MSTNRLRSGGMRRDCKALLDSQCHFTAPISRSEGHPMVLIDTTPNNRTVRKKLETLDISKTMTRTMNKNKVKNWFTIKTKNSGQMSVRLVNWIAHGEASPISNEHGDKDSSNTKKCGKCISS